MPLHDHWRLLDPLPADPSIPLSSPLIRSVMARRGIADAESARQFLAPSRDDLHDPASIHGMDYACERIARAVRDREAILIYGDYDVDGVTSIVLLRTVLRYLGADVDFVVPHRLVDGYGLKIEVLERVLVDRHVGLVITVDCGITSVEPVKKALDRGIDVIITDHHLPPGTLPEAAAVLNPRQPGCAYPFKDLAGVGVAFKLCCELLRRAGRKMSIDSLLKIAAIGTVADVAPLIGENRTIVRLGLDGLAEARNPGLRSLVRNLGLGGRPLRASDVGFKIGPRINAAGRLASADTAIRLFDAVSDEEAFPLVAELNRLNAERQKVEKALIAAAEQQIERDPLPRFLLLAGDGWHKGVLGLCAGKIAQRYHRPTLVVSREGDQCVGSGRSISRINLHAALERVGDDFTHFGGHEFACGFSFEASKLERLRERLGEVFAELEEECYRRELELEGELTLAQVTAEFGAEHAQLEPFGAGNRRPVFLLRGARIERRREFSEHCWELSLRDGAASGRAVVWPSNSEAVMALVEGHEAVDFAVELEPDAWAPAGIAMVVVDAAPAGSEQLLS